MPDPAMTETHTIEIPPAILARKLKTLDQCAKLAFIPLDSEAGNTPTAVGSFSGPSGVPSLPPKSKTSYPPSKKLSIPSLPESPILKPKISPVSQAMAARPLPKLPLISDDDDDMNYFSMRCDYDKVDYTKMRYLRDMAKITSEQNDGAQRQKVKPKLSKSKLFIRNPTVPVRNIPRRKEIPTDNTQAKCKPPPVAKKPAVKPRRQSVNVSDLVK